MASRQTRSSRPLGEVSVNIVQEKKAKSAAKAPQAHAETTTDHSSTEKENDKKNNERKHSSKAESAYPLCNAEQRGCKRAPAAASKCDRRSRRSSVPIADGSRPPEVCIFTSCCMNEGAGDATALALEAPLVVLASSSKDCNASSEGAPLDLSLASSPDENAETFQPNDIVWAKIFGFPWWPAVITDVMERKGSYAVRFFGTGEIGHCKSKDLKPYAAPGTATLPVKLKTHAFLEAVREAETALKGCDGGASANMVVATVSKSKDLYTSGRGLARKKVSKAEKQRRAEEFERGRIAEEERLRTYFSELDNKPVVVEFD